MDMVFRCSDGNYLVVSARLSAPEDIVRLFGPLEMAGYLNLGLLERRLYQRICGELDLQGFASLGVAETTREALRVFPEH